MCSIWSGSFGIFVTTRWSWLEVIVGITSIIKCECWSMCKGASLIWHKPRQHSKLAGEHQCGSWVNKYNGTWNVKLLDDLLLWLFLIICLPMGTIYLLLCFNWGTYETRFHVKVVTNVFWLLCGENYIHISSNNCGIQSQREQTNNIGIITPP